MILGLESEEVAAGPFALLVVGVLLVVTVALIKNMGSRLRNLPEEFPEDPRGLRRADGPEDGVERDSGERDSVERDGEHREPPESERRGS